MLVRMQQERRRPAKPNPLSNPLFANLGLGNLGGTALVYGEYDPSISMTLCLKGIIATITKSGVVKVGLSPFWQNPPSRLGRGSGARGNIQTKDPGNERIEIIAFQRMSKL